MIKHFVFDGQKSVPLSQWRPDEKSSSAQTLRATVAYIYRAVELRANAVSAMPFSIFRRDTAVYVSGEQLSKELKYLKNLNDLLWKVEASTILYGAGYWFVERNLVRVLALQSMATNTVRFEKMKFIRNADGKQTTLTADDVIYFFPPDPDVELGPATHYPLLAASGAGNIAASSADFVKTYFERGLIKSTILTYDGVMSEKDRQELKSWWERLMSGVSRAWRTAVLRSDIKPIVVGDGLGDLDDETLADSTRQEMAVAFGVPRSKLDSNAANYATKIGDDKAFIDDTVLPKCIWIASVLNEQLFSRVGLSIKFQPERLAVMQTDEQLKAERFELYRRGGLSLEAALALAGLTVPHGIAIAESKTTIDETKNDELSRLKRWASKRTNPQAEQFKSDILSIDEIRNALKTDPPPDRAQLESAWQSELEKFLDEQKQRVMERANVG